MKLASGDVRSHHLEQGRRDDGFNFQAIDVLGDIDRCVSCASPQGNSASTVVAVIFCSMGFFTGVSYFGFEDACSAQFAWITLLASPLSRSLLLLPQDLFDPVAVARADDTAPGGGAKPLLLKGVAAEWPATLLWSFEYLAKIGGPQAVRLVVGNRESGRTVFTDSALDDYLLALHRDGSSCPGEPAPYLKEFGLLRHMPSLRGDIRPDELFSRHHIVSSSAWIGPAGAHTGLHRDYLDNLAVLLRGRKRFFLARPGTIELLGGVSRKFDRWARLSRIGMTELAALGLASGSLYVVDLEPGDALYVPHGWWHEVVNQQSSIFLSGFFGSYPKVIGRWLSTGLQQASSRRQYLDSSL